MNDITVYLNDSNAYATPEYQTAGAAGMDLHASNDETIVLRPGDRKLIPTGLKMSIPQGYECQIRPRSGLVFKHGVTVLNSPGTIDSDYRGEIGVILHNDGDKNFFVNRGDRIAQAVFAKYERVEFIYQEELEATDRGEGGFGSTGKK